MNASATRESLPFRRLNDNHTMIEDDDNEEQFSVYSFRSSSCVGIEETATAAATATSALPDVDESRMIDHPEQCTDSPSRSPFSPRSVDVAAIAVEKDNSSLSSSSSSSPLQYTSMLIDREDQWKDLLRAFNRSTKRNVNNPKAELTLITGQSGSGKSALAFELKRHCQSMGGYFLTGKFDQYQTLGLPYHAFVQAFTEFVHQLLQRDDAETHKLKQRIEQAVESDSKLLTYLIPALEQVIADGGEAVAIKGAELQNRFKRVFRKFVKAIASKSAPVVLMLDDLQWSDASSLDLLREIIPETQNEGFMILGACRGNEVSIDHQLSVVLRDLENSGVSVREIRVANLDEPAVNRFLSQRLALPTEQCSFLSTIAYDNTQGNIFFLKQYLQSLIESKLLSQNKEGSWVWDDERIQSSPRCYDVVQLIAQKISELDEAVQRVLKVASCLGSEFDQNLLIDVFGDELDVTGALMVATDNDLLVVDEQNRVIRFVHDKIQQACYSLIPEEDRRWFHLDLGRTLWNNSSSDDVGWKIFLIVNQLSIGADLVESADERCRIAILCHRAAEKASASSAFITAAEYLDLGIGLLSRRHWRDEYDTSLALFSAQSEVESVLGNFDKVDETNEAIFENARSFRDKLRAYTVKVYMLGAKNQPGQAIATGFDVLKKLGERFPSKGRTISIITGLIRTKTLLRRFDDDSISNLPIMEDPDKLAAMRMLAILVPYTFSCKPEFLPLINFRMIEITLKAGICATSCTGFAAYGMLLCCAFGNVEEGYRYGQLALKIAHQFSSLEWYARCYTAVYGMINTWKDPLRDSLQPLRRAHLLGLSTGDIEFGMLSAAIYSTLSIFSASRPLSELEVEMLGFRQLMIDCNQDHTLSMLLPNLQLALNLQGLSEDPIVLTGNFMNQDLAVKQAIETNNSSVLSAIFQYRMILAYYLGEYRVAFAVANERTKVAGSSPMVSAFGEANQHFIECLNALALARVEWRRYYLRLARKKYKALEKIAKYGRGSVLNRITLLNGEFAAVYGKVDLACEYYNHCARCAAESEDRSDQALAYERAGIILLEANRVDEGMKYLRQASDVYEQWGATIKVNQIRASF